ncbi:MAG TPA: hypothetical protein DIS79_05710 [Bacteroidetes bacterium]|nr:hypothetical protein [Bacteroidota bacterium]HRK04896.1 endonuclease/exonuclease/phosphatase family protein [Chlorobiota bacterium]
MLYVVLTIVLTMLAGCTSTQTQSSAPENFVTVATFNTEWLGDGVNDRVVRSDADYLRIADIIAKTEADVIGLQEVENTSALRKLLRYLDGYQGVLVDAGSPQQCAVIYQKSVTIDTSWLYRPLAIQPERHRPGLVVHCRKGNLDWLMMVVHLKSTSRYDSTPALRDQSRIDRSAQAEVVSRWVDSTAKAGKETDILIVGDFNDFPLRKQNATLTALTESGTVTFLTEKLKSCRSPQLYVIDHVAASASAARRFVRESERTENFYAFLPDEDARKISDHCPVIVRFDVTAPDND